MKFGINRVKIRILSGGKEHSTLESLRESFSLEDVLPSYIDGRLATWLRQRDEDDLADRLEKIQADGIKSPKLELKLINEFFGTEYKSVLEYAKCCQNASNADLAYDYVTSLKNETELIELARLGKLSPEKAKAKGVCGKTMYIICRTLLKDAGDDKAKKEKAYPWKYQADKLDDEETKEFRKTDSYDRICDDVPKENKSKSKILAVDNNEAVDIDLSVYWSKDYRELTDTPYDKKWQNNFDKNWHLPSENEANELIDKIKMDSNVIDNGIMIGDDTNGLHLPFFYNKYKRTKHETYGYLWLSNGDALFYYTSDSIENFRSCSIVKNLSSKGELAYIIPVKDKNAPSTSAKIANNEVSIIGETIEFADHAYGPIEYDNVKYNIYDEYGYGNWRLPNLKEVEELKKIIELKSKVQITPNGDGIYVPIKNKDIFLPFFWEKKNGNIWVHPKLTLEYNNERKCKIDNRPTKAYLLPVRNI